MVKGNEKPEVSYSKRKGKYMKQKGVTLPKINNKLKVKARIFYLGKLKSQGQKMLLIQYLLHLF